MTASVREREEIGEFITKKYNRSTIGNRSTSSKFIDLDSSRDEVSNKQSKSGKTNTSDSTRSKPVSTPPTSDEDVENTPKPKPKPKITIPSSGSESDTSIPMLKIGPPKKSTQKEPQPKKSAPKNEDHPTPKPKKQTPEHLKPIDDQETLQNSIKRPIALSGPAQNNDDDLTRYRFLRTLSHHPTFQQLI
jgi:hypothetical protein